MYRDSSPATARRSAETPRRRGACQKPMRRPAIAVSGVDAGRPQPISAGARRSRLDDAIVAQWLLDQIPSDHRHALTGASNGHALAA